MSATLIVGDLHLGAGVSIGKPGIGTALNSRIIDQLKLLDWVLDTSLDHNANTVIFTGDICEDSKPDYILVELFIEFLKRCEAYNIIVHIIAGNHDIKRTGKHYTSFLDVLTAAELSGVYVHKYINTIISNGVGFTLLPFRDRKSLSCKTDTEAFEKISAQLTYELEEVPRGCDRVLIGHLALKGSIFVGNEFDNLANELMCPLDMFFGYDYVWMGHVHKPQVRSKSPYIAHIGSLDISDFGETDHTKIVIVYDPDIPDKFTTINVPSRPLRRICIDVPEGFDSTNFVVDQIKAQDKLSPLKSAIVKIEIKLLDEDMKNVDRDLIEKTTYELGAYYISNLLESRNISVVPISNIHHDVTNAINPKLGIKIWSEHNFDADDERNAYTDLATKYVNIFNENQ